MECRKETNLENLMICNASFQSVIGTIYYLWIGPNRDKKIDKELVSEVVNEAGNETGHETGWQVKLSLLVNEKDAFENYVEKLKENSYKEGRCSLQEKKSAKIENYILDYLSGKVKNIGIDTCFLSGSDFEKKIWNTAVLIPYGKTLSYKELAEKAGFPLAWRAVGTALGHNPVMLAVPCHRIIKSDGSIGNFGGGIKVKEFLLNLEALNR